MKDTEFFLNVCQGVIADVAAGHIDYMVAAQKISEYQYNFGPLAHPMLFKIADMAEEITEDYRGDIENRAYWDVIVTAVQHYFAGNWDSTRWSLSATYGKYVGKIPQHSFGIAAYRLNGETTIETASKQLNDAVAVVAKRLNIEQTDERYLRNLAMLLPANVEEYTLIDMRVRESLFDF